MRLRIEDAETVEVGKFYVVPTVFVPTLPRGLQIVPVVGPAHEDAEFIGFPHRHVHPDRRFVSDRWFARYDVDTASGQPSHWSIVYNFVIEVDPKRFQLKPGPTGVEWREPMAMKCKRLLAPFRDDAPWLRKLERAYATETLREGMVCPHRGITCKGVQVDEKGCVVCPGHGLMWSAERGHLVSRTGQDFRQIPLIQQ